MLVNEVGCIENDRWKGGEASTGFYSKFTKVR